MYPISHQRVTHTAVILTIKNRMPREVRPNLHQYRPTSTRRANERGIEPIVAKLCRVVDEPVAAVLPSKVARYRKLRVRNARQCEKHTYTKIGHRVESVNCHHVTYALDCQFSCDCISYHFDLFEEVPYTWLYRRRRGQ